MSTSQKIFLLGATGVSGLQFIPIALAHDEHLTLVLYVRNASKIPTEFHSHPRVTIVTGSLTDIATLTSAMKGVTAVISFLGAYPSLSAFITRTKTTPIADSFPSVFTAMRANGIKRILALSTPNFVSKDDKPSWSYWAYNLVPPFAVPQGSAEMKGIGKQVSSQKDLEWTVFRVPMMNDAEDEELKVAAGSLGEGFLGGLGLSRKSMIKWLLEELVARKFVCEMPALGNY